jgi:hypothetical protein
VLLRLAYLTITNAFAALRLLPMSDRDKDAEILVLRHLIMVLERQLGTDRVKFTSEDRAFLAALLVPLPRQVLRRLRLLVQPDTALRWHRHLIKQRHARTCRPKRPGRPPTVRSIRILILRLVRENPSWGYRTVHGELGQRPWMGFSARAARRPRPACPRFAAAGIRIPSMAPLLVEVSHRPPPPHERPYTSSRRRSRGSAPGCGWSWAALSSTA